MNKENIRILMISLDRGLFDEKSDVRRRLRQQAAHVDEIHVVVFAKKSLGLKYFSLDNLHVYPTNSKNKFKYFSDALRIGKEVLSNTQKEWVITTQDPYETGIAGLLLARKTSVPLQVQVHTDLFNPIFIRRPISNILRMYVARYILPKASGLRVVCERVKRSIVDVCGSEMAYKIQVLPVFVNLEVFLRAGEEKQKDKETVNVLVVSRLEKEKNVELSLTVIEEIVHKHNNVHCTVVGDGALMEEFKNTVQKFDNGNCVEFVGWQHDIASYYKKADIFLNTSNYEGYGRTLVEAAAAKCAVVTTDVGIVGDVLTGERGVRICAPGDKDCLVRKLSELCSNESLREQYATQACSEVSMRATVEKEEYYRLLVSGWRDLLPS